MILLTFIIVHNVDCFRSSLSRAQSPPCDVKVSRHQTQVFGEDGGRAGAQANSNNTNFHEIVAK